jgi:hypothetical protein
VMKKMYKEQTSSMRHITFHKPLRVKTDKFNLFLQENQHLLFPKEVSCPRFEL